ncbi:MAG: IS701 family transposase [Vicinamibacterales bacterium]
MDVQELREVRRDLSRFVSKFSACIKTKQSRAHLRTYVTGQLGSLERKSIEPMALEAGVAPRTLQEFLSFHRWDETRVGRRLRAWVKRTHPDPNAIGVIDETGFAKKGDKTTGVQRQYCGSTGKTDNCLVSVHLGYVTEDFHAILDGDLYLPKSWTEDPQRRRAAGIPEDVVFRPKWRIALDLMENSRAEGVLLRWITADEFYGRAREFREGVAAMGYNYVVEIPSNLTGWTRAPQVEPAGSVRASGRTLKRSRVAEDEREARAVSDLWHRGGPSWQLYQVKETQKGLVVWEVRETRFFPNRDGVPGEEVRLLIARDVLTGEMKYFLAHAPGKPTKEILCVAFSRWHIERLFEDSKGEVGLDHFEVRKHRSLRRHLILSQLSIAFLADRTTELRKKNLLVEPLSGAQGRGGATRLDRTEVSKDAPIGTDGGQDRVLATSG